MFGGCCRGAVRHWLACRFNHPRMMKKILVTGACGFIGRQLSRKLAAMGCQVRGVDLRRDSSAGIDVWPADITAQSLDPKVFEDIDAVFHLAGKVHALSEARQDEGEYFRINTEGTRHVLEGARKCGVRRVVFFSTVKAMSRDGEGGGRSSSDSVRSDRDTRYAHVHLRSGRDIPVVRDLRPDQGSGVHRHRDRYQRGGQLATLSRGTGYSQIAFACRRTPSRPLSSRRGVTTVSVVSGITRRERLR